MTLSDALKSEWDATRSVLVTFWRSDGICHLIHFRRDVLLSDLLQPRGSIRTAWAADGGRAVAQLSSLQLLSLFAVVSHFSVIAVAFRSRGIHSSGIARIKSEPSHPGACVRVSHGWARRRLTPFQVVKR